MNSLKSILGSYLGHLTSYLVSAATIVAGLDPKLVPPQYSFLVATAGLVVTAAHHGYTAGTAQQVVKVVTDTLAQAPAKLVVAALMLAMTLTVGSQLTACATMQKAFSPNAAPYVTAAVDVAVATAESKGVQAVKINAIAKQALAADTGAGASLAAVTALVNAQVAKLNLPAADLAAVQILEVALTAAVQQQIGQNPNVAVAQADVAQLLNAVIAATGG